MSTQGAVRIVDDHPLTVEERDALRDLSRTLGDAAAAARLGVSRHLLARAIAGGLVLRAGSIVLIRLRLAEFALAAAEAA